MMLFSLLLVMAAEKQWGAPVVVAPAVAEVIGERTLREYDGVITEAAIEAEAANVGAQACRAAEVKLDRFWRYDSGDLMPDQIAGYASGPVLVQRVRFSGCGRTSMQNIQVYRGRNRYWETRPLLPGMSLTGPLLQFQTMELVVQVAQKSRTFECQPLAKGPTVDPVVLVQETDLQGVWKERWSFAMCGRTLRSDIVFTKRPEGGTDYNVQVAWSQP